MKRIVVALIVGFQFTMAHAAGLIADPEKFDFGWSPRNAQVTAEFTVTNVGPDLIPLNSIDAACGCTAANFTPATLSSKQDTKFAITFNTKGYDGTRFVKPANLKTDSEEQNIRVLVKGHVMDYNAKLFPVGDGVLSFLPGDKKKKVIRIQNSSDKEIVLKQVQGPAIWAKAAISSENIKPYGTIDMSVELDSIPKKERTTSLTYEGVSGSKIHRFTVAIRSGEKPKKRRIKAPRKSSTK